MKTTITSIVTMTMVLTLAAGCSSGDDDDGAGGAGGDSGGGGAPAGGSGGGASGGSGGAPVELTGFAKIHKEIIMPSCSGPLCHSGEAGGSLIMSTVDLAYENLIDVPASPLHKCGGADGGVAWTRVVPGNPDESLLFQKLSLDPPCGDPMPIAGTLDDAQIEEIRQWIADGAPRD